MGAERKVKLFRNGGNLAVRIPREFEAEFGGDEATLRFENGLLTIEPVRKGRLVELLDSWDPLDETFPDVDEGLLPLDEPEL